jgi:importin subunit beta-1
LDYDLIEYVSQLREGILEAYTGIVTGFKNTDKGTPLLSRPHVTLLIVG